MDTAFARTSKRRSAVVGEWMNALSAPAAEIKRTGHFLLPLASPPSVRPSAHLIVRSFVHLFVRSLARLFVCFSAPTSLPLPFSARIIRQAVPRIQAKSTDAGWPLESLMPRWFMAKLYHSLFCILFGAFWGSPRISRPFSAPFPLLKLSLSRDKCLLCSFDAVII